MPTMRTCCCTVTELGKPLLVRSGWYHFLVLTESGGVSCLVGSPTRTRNDNKTYYNLPAGAPVADVQGPTSWCSDSAVPIEAPTGHPLCVPVGVKSATRSGALIKDITCGAYHNLVRTSDNRIIAWGLNAMGQCNVPATLANGTHPKAARIVGLHAGYSTSAVTFNDGTVLCWGDPVVADDVNSWTDLMMSPINNQPDPISYDETNNVAADNVKFAKPYYEGAYSTTVTETWNLLQDPKMYWHGDNAPHPRWNLGYDKACVPFFDLGVETDPAHPLELKTYGFTSGADEFPSVGTQFPVNWFGTPDPPCYNEVGCLTHPERFADWLAMRWRNMMLKTPDGRKSCCDLQIKRDFAIGLKRTGQMITSRRPDAGGSNPNKNAAHCPAASTTCRDCSADQYQSLLLGSGVDNQSGCVLAGSFQPGKHLDQVLKASCPCASAGGEFDTPTTGTYYKTGCPICPDDFCPADRRFSLNGFCAGSFETVPRFFEGIGCMASSIRAEKFLYDPNWARNFAFGSMSSAMYEPGEQVRYINSTTYFPSINGPVLQENWGWSTKPTSDIVQTPTTYCTVRHTAATLANEPFCHPEVDGDGITGCPNGDMVNTCKAICKSSTADEYAYDDILPLGTAYWQYPVQFFSNGVLAGTNTTVWTSVPDTIYTFFDGDCASCNTAQLSLDTPGCYDTRFQREDITQGASGGYVTYSCIYAGELYGENVSRDKYGHRNSYVEPGATSNMPTTCTDFSTKLYAPYYLKAPSKPWGPFSFVLTNGFGEKSIPGMTPCHCFTSPFQDDGAPNQRCPNLGAVEPPNLLRIAGYDTTLYDNLMGTRSGFPRESNLQCRFAGCNGRDCTETNPPIDSLCNPTCSTYSSHWKEASHGDVPAFCMHNPFISYASGRLAFAVVRGDHRRTEGSPAARISPDMTNNFPPRKIDGTVVEDDPYGFELNGTKMVDRSQQPGCNCTSGGPNGTYTCTPYVASDWVVHVWGNLWDPCPPWPRTCDNTRIPQPVAGAGCATAWDKPNDDVSLETGEDVAPEMNWVPGPSETWGPCALYPSWTRLPNNPAAGADPRFFSSKKGTWQKIAGTWKWIANSDGLCEPSIGDTMYCPDCSVWEKDYEPPVSEWG